MTLSEKIYYCRKKSGRSQEALAEALGVSRQAVSKWETGDAEPELGKLRALAAEFNVSVDWLLSTEEPPDAAEYAPPEVQSTAAEVLDAVPGFLGKMLNRFGWLYGVYVAMTGAMLTLVGGIARYLSRAMLSGFERQFTQMSGSASGVTLYDSAGKVITDPELIQGFADAAGIEMQTASDLAMFNPVAAFGGIMMAVGILLMLAGIVLAIYLRKKSRE